MLVARVGPAESAEFAVGGAELVELAAPAAAE